VSEVDVKQLYSGPDEHGHFGQYGGIFVGETLMPALEELIEVYSRLKHDQAFWDEFHDDLKNYVGRPSPLYHAANMSKALGGAQIYLKREDLNHTGAHKVNNTIGRLCWPKPWVKPALLPKPVPASTG